VISPRRPFSRRRPLLFLERLRRDGIQQTCERMQELVQACHFDPRLIVRRAAEQIVARTPGGDRLAESRAIFRWVRCHVRYTRDPAHLEYLQDPRQLLAVIDARWLAFGDCDDHAMLTAALALSLRIPVVWVLVARLEDLDFAHVYAALLEQPASALHERAALAHAAWLLGDSKAPSGLVSLDTASPQAEWGRHPRGGWRLVVPCLS
jgi:hypothetical protein